MSDNQAEQRSVIEIELKDLRNEFEMFFNLVPSPVCIASPDGYFKKVNTAWTTILGYSQEELLSKPFFDFIHPEDIALTKNEIEKQHDGQCSKKFINRYRCKDGSFRFLEWESATSYDGFFYATARDITENKLAEHKLKESEDKYRTQQEFLGLLINTIPNPIFYKDRQGKYLGVNSAFENFIGMSAKDIIGKSVFEISPKNIAEEYWQKDNELFENPGVQHYEWKVRRKNGEIYDVIFDKASFTDSLGTLSGLIGIITDITKRKQAEKILVESERLLSESQKGGNIGSWAWYFNSKLAEWSDQLYIICGRDIDMGPPDLDSFIETCHPDDRVQLQKNIEKSINNDVPYSCVFRIFREDNGEERWISSQGKVEKDDDGKPNRLMGISQDITEKRKIEESMQKAQKLESLGILAGGIAHDFNNILGGIYSNIEMAMLKTSEENVSTYLATSISSIDRVRSLTGQFLTFAKGGDPIKKIEKLFPFVQETTHFALSGSSVSSRFQIEEDLWPCNFDKNQIGQVIDNLIINAQQAMAGGGTIEISASNISLPEKEHHALAAGNYVKLSITDHGTGISKDDLSSIFDPYYTTKPEGSGLGLSTCYSIINRHEGFIDVESEPGKGSIFHVYLPASTESSSIRVEDLTGEASCEHVGSGTLLVMDDEKIIRESIKDILEDFGYTVVLKENGEDAIDFFLGEIKANRKLAGIIFDLTIPGGMGGKEAIGEIRKICSETPAFVVSGYSSDPVIANPEEYGFNASLSKPFKMAELSELLEKHMKNLK